jgi:hypothetical protein
MMPTITVLATIVAIKSFSNAFSATMSIIIVVTVIGLICLTVKALLSVDDDCDIDRADRVENQFNINAGSSHP